MIGAVRNAFSAVRALCAEVRHMQQDALAEAQRLDALDMAVQQHAVHPAMWSSDPLIDALFQQVEHDQADPATTAARVTPEQWAALADTQADDWWLDWLIPAIATGCVLWVAFARLGWIPA